MNENDFCFELLSRKEGVLFPSPGLQNHADGLHSHVLNKKAHLTESDELLNMIKVIISKLYSDLSVSPGARWNWHLFITRGYKRLSRLLRAITLSLS
jgi:hypothetical protein